MKLKLQAKLSPLRIEWKRHPPLTVSFYKTIKSAHILAVSDEDGYVSLFDTRYELLSSKTCTENAEKARIANWVAHENVVFYICWIKDDAKILTVSGDQTAASMSITSVLYLKDGVSIATAGAVDSIVRFWDIRNLRAPVTQICPHLGPDTKTVANFTRCHEPSCNAAVVEDMVNQLVSREDRKKYSRYFVRCYIENKKKVKVPTWIDGQENIEYVGVGARFGPTLESKGKHANQTIVAVADPPDSCSVPKNKVFLSIFSFSCIAIDCSIAYSYVWA
ncbi:hypothetical protein Dimus_037225 [Dionaea muscipula]